MLIFYFNTQFESVFEVQTHQNKLQNPVVDMFNYTDEYRYYWIITYITIVT